MDLKVINYCYYNNLSQIEEYNAPILVFICRDRNLKRRLVFICDKENLAPEFYAEERAVKELLFGFVEGEELPKDVIKWDDAPNSNYGEKTMVLYTTFPWQVKNTRKTFSHTYLADIKWEKMCIEKMGLKTPYIRVSDDFNNRWIKSYEIEELPQEEHFYVPIKWIGWDIETNAEVVFPIFNGWKDAEKCPIISNHAYDSYEKKMDCFFWHPKVDEEEVFEVDPWERKGKYYVPALKNYKEYNLTIPRIIHSFNNEKRMLEEYFLWYAKKQPDAQFGFNSEGGFKITSRKGRSRKRWFNGFDMPYLYHRSKTLGLEDEIQKMSPLPNRVRGVNFRKNGRNVSVDIKGVCQIDFIYTNEIFMYHKKFNDFRGGNLQSYMSFFLGFGKLYHKEQIFEMWRDNVPSDYDPKPEVSGTKKRKNYVKLLYENAINNWDNRK